jgi:tetratricopeptide (TPR) repeat protein
LTGAQRILRPGFAVEMRPFAADTPFLVRLGINHREYTLGCGVGAGQVSFDYAVAFHELETLHRFGLTLRYNILSDLDEKRIKTERLRALKQEAGDWLKAGDFEKSEAAVRHIVELEESDPDAPLITAQIQKRRAEAQAHIRAAAAKAEALRGFAEAKKFYLSKLYRKALDAIEPGLPLLQDNPQAQGIAVMARAHVFLEEGDYPSALEQLSKAVELDPDNREAAVLYKRTKDISESREGD